MIFRFSRIFIISVFCILMARMSVHAQDECKSIEVTVETTATVGSNDGRVSILMTKGDRKSVKYIFCEEGGKVLNENHFDKAEMDGLKKGRYLCIVNTNDCSKRVFFNID